ncbi:transcriptional regulator [Chromobacterium sp. ATCC 53434]|uniref:Rrf2 family transcriptional regulator n=1 Tax=Chromobacterium sp. (strain ATCC 53434 / SC 14030) TaxID=2059672 RepID=UPI000C785062|nr:Rrf2 family transcriptional regulator [Chromobacterium sp. ATCC 53434]AUH50828.1 transcriptional regulator [Chromobacterium sp. ATCC 53434]
MQRDTRLARLLHVLIHMYLRGGTTTSETIAQMLHTQPSLVRRTMAALREAGHVASIPGPNGGWMLCRELADLTVRDIYAAITHKSAFAISAAHDNPACPVETTVNRVLDAALSSAEEALLQHLAQIRLSDLAQHAKASAG